MHPTTRRPLCSHTQPPQIPNPDPTPPPRMQAAAKAAPEAQALSMLGEYGQKIKSPRALTPRTPKSGEKLGALSLAGEPAENGGGEGGEEGDDMFNDSPTMPVNPEPCTLNPEP